MTKGYAKKDLEQIVIGEWYREPVTEDWYVDTVTIARKQILADKTKKALFIAIDSDTWHAGSKNKSIYAGWKDTHQTVKTFESLITGVIAQRPIPELDPRIPQYIIENTYEVIQLLAEASYRNYQGHQIAITGTAGKSTSKNLLAFLLGEEHTVEATRGNHNTRTGVPLTIASAITQPDYLVVEAAISGLWMRPHGIMRTFPPEVALITSIDGGQNKSAFETAVLKAKIAEGMNNQGTVIINQEAKELQVLCDEVKKYNQNIITYGLTQPADSYLVSYNETKGKAALNANILGELVTFETQLLGQAMAQNIIGVLTTLKILNVPLQPLLSRIGLYEATKGVQKFEEIKRVNATNFTLLDDSWNATGIAMIEAIMLFKRQAQFYKGKKIAILGRIENLGKEEAKKQHEALVEPLIEGNIDLVFAHGPEMKYALKKLPETLIGGYFETSQELVKAVTPLIDDDAFVLFKGSRRASDFKEVKAELLAAVQKEPIMAHYVSQHPFATGAGAITYDLETHVIIGSSGDIAATQNQGVGNLLLVELILERLFSKKLQLEHDYLPGKQALHENDAVNAIRLKEHRAETLYSILLTAIVNNAPNSLLMLANDVMGNNRATLAEIRARAQTIGVNDAALANLTGRRITNKTQVTSLVDLYKVAQLLFKKYPQELALLSANTVMHQHQMYRVKTNLYKNGTISHGFFYGERHSTAVVLTQKENKRYVTVVLGATNAYERDQLITDALDNCATNSEPPLEITKENYRMNIIGDTYFGEFYTKIRQRQGKKDGLQTKGRAYSFDGIRSELSQGDFNICNFEAALSDEPQHPLKQRKPYILHADVKETVPIIKEQHIHLVTLGNNHLMDCGREGLVNTLDHFDEANITTIGAGLTQAEAEKPYIKSVNKQRVAIFNAYWYGNQMYLDYDFYAIGQSPGVACLSGKIKENIRTEKRNHPTGLVLVIAHWGADFEKVNIKQRKDAHSLLEAGADLIIGHGAHMIQEIEKVNDKLIVYSIGNGVFNSNGEYNRRFVAPYGLFAQLIQSNGQWQLRLYPLYTNNLKTFWQPYFVNAEQFNHCSDLLASFGSTELVTRQDEQKRFYYHLTI